MAWQQRVYEGVPLCVWDALDDKPLIEIWSQGDKVNLWGIYSGMVMPKGTKVPDFPYYDLNPEFILCQEASCLDHLVVLEGKYGLVRRIISQDWDFEWNRMYSSAKNVGPGFFEDFIAISKYCAKRLPRIADEIVWYEEQQSEVECLIDEMLGFEQSQKPKPGLVVGENYTLQVDMKKYQDAVSKVFYSLMKQFTIQRAAVSIDKGGLTAEQIKEVLGLIEPLNVK